MRNPIDPTTLPTIRTTEEVSSYLKVSHAVYFDKVWD